MSKAEQHHLNPTEGMYRFMRMASRESKKQPLTAPLRAALKARLASGETLLTISMATGIPRMSLGRFLAGENLRLDSGDRLAAELGLKLVGQRAKRPASKRTSKGSK